MILKTINKKFCLLLAATILSTSLSASETKNENESFLSANIAKTAQIHYTGVVSRIVQNRRKTSTKSA